MTIQQTYGQARWGREYGYRDPKNYSLGFHRGFDLRKLNAAETASVVTTVESLSAGTVHSIVRAPGGKVGLVIVVETSRKRGRYEMHSHNAGVVVKEGAKVAAGGKLARNAEADEKPGTAWTAPHDHFVISDYPDAAWNTDRPTYDPLPFIRDALAAAAATPSKEKEEMPTLVSKSAVAGQIIKAKSYLYLDAKKTATSVLSGAQVVVDGNLYLRVTTKGGPLDEGFPASIQVTPVIETWDAKQSKTTATSSLGVHEVVVTAGSTFALIPVPPHKLKANQRLRFYIEPFGITELKIAKATFRAATFK